MTTGAVGLVNAGDDFIGTLASPRDPKLAPLADNIGFSQTHAILPESPARDAGRISLLRYWFENVPLLNDQRGLGRVAGINPDIGAYELIAASVPLSTRPFLQNDSGVSNSDGITNANTGIFVVDNLVPGISYDLQRNGVPVATFVPADRSLFITDLAPPSDATVNYLVRPSSIPGNPPGNPSEITVVKYDHIAPTVTINQASGQADPAALMPLRFAVTFSEPVSFDSFNGAFDLTGSVNIDGLIFSRNGSGPVYTFEGNGLRGPAVVVMSLPANKATDLAGNFNTASVNGDNSITFQPQAYFGSVTGRVRKSGGSVPHPGAQVLVVEANGGPSYYAVVNSSGYYHVKNVLLYVGITKNFSIGIYRKMKLLHGTGFTLTGDMTFPDRVVPY